MCLGAAQRVVLNAPWRAVQARPLQTLNYVGTTETVLSDLYCIELVQDVGIGERIILKCVLK